MSGWSDLLVGCVSAVPYVVAAIGMVIVGNHSDRTGERRWHVAVPMAIGAIGFFCAASLQTPIASLLALTLAALGIWSALGPFWTLPTAFLAVRPPREGSP